jgi:hypothetical protein
MKIILLSVTLAGGCAASWWYLTRPRGDAPHLAANAAAAAALDDPSTLPEPVGVITAGKAENHFPDSARVQADGEEVETRFAGQLTRYANLYVVKLPVYSVAAYLEPPDTGRDAEGILQNMMVDGLTRVYVIRFERNVSGAQLEDAFRKEIDATFGDVDMPRLKPRIDTVLAQFGKGAKKGDRVYMVWRPGGRLHCGFGNPHAIGPVAVDIPLARAFWRIWAGEQNADRTELVRGIALPAPRAP